MATPRTLKLKMPACQILIETKRNGRVNGKIIYGFHKSEHPCRNYAMKGKTCCWSHRSLENTVYVEDQEKIVREFVSKIFKKIESDIIEKAKFRINESDCWPIVHANIIINQAQNQAHGLAIVSGFLIKSDDTSDLYLKRLAVLIAAEYFFRFPVHFDQRTLGNTIVRKLIEAGFPERTYINKLEVIINK